MLKIERELVIMPTYKCPASCSNCGTNSSPKRKEVIALDMMKRYIEEAATLGFRIVVFSGGEATLRWRDLIRAISIAKDHHLPTRLVTNGFWAKSPDCAGKKLGELGAAGLDEINITTGQEHLRFVPMQSVVNLIGCVVSKSMDSVVNVEATTKKEGEMIRDSLLRQITHIDEWQKEQRLKVILSPWVNINSNTQPCKRIYDPTNWPIEVAGCDSILSTYTLRADGTLAACCGLAMEDISELVLEEGITLQQAIKKAEGDVVKMAIRYIGPAKLLAMYLNHSDNEPHHNYTHQCQSCFAFYYDGKVREWFLNNHENIVESIIEHFVVDELIIPDILDNSAKGLSRTIINMSIRESKRRQLPWFPPYLMPSAAVWEKAPGASFEGRYFLGSRGGR